MPRARSLPGIPYAVGTMIAGCCADESGRLHLQLETFREIREGADQTLDDWGT